MKKVVECSIKNCNDIFARIGILWYQGGIAVLLVIFGDTVRSGCNEAPPESRRSLEREVLQKTKGGHGELEDKTGFL